MFVRKYLDKLKYFFIIKLATAINKADLIISKKTLPILGRRSKSLIIELPRKFLNPERIFIGDNVSLGPGSFLYAQSNYPTAWMQHPTIKQPKQVFDSKIVIGNNVTATANLQISALSEIIIEDDVMFASNIHINDCLHGFESANIPYKYQKINRISPIRIERGCWIGQNVVILPGVTIGQHAIIGANSVVSKNIPPKSIAVGIPAKVIKTWDEISNSWASIAGKNSK